jgi:hypothetical protein
MVSMVAVPEVAASGPAGRRGGASGYHREAFLAKAVVGGMFVPPG